MIHLEIMITFGHDFGEEMDFSINMYTTRTMHWNTRAPNAGLVKHI